MKYLTTDERKCPYLVFQAVMDAIHMCGIAQLDCGHIVKNNINLNEQEDGQFITLCEKCSKSKYN